MKFKKSNSEIFEADLTPMIDMTFNLIAFFMFTISFVDADRVEQIMLPKSNLAKPPQTIPDYQIILNLDQDGSVFFDGQRIQKIELINPILRREIAAAQREDVEAGAISVVIRAHEDTESGEVQTLIKKCQENELQKFALRVKEDR
jgi:biopolymer transport protein ExbD